MGGGMSSHAGLRLLAAVLAALVLSPGAAEGGAYGKGDHVLISGQVRDTEGAAIGNITVLLELTHSSFSLRRFRRVETNTLRLPVVTTVDGRYLHDWRWDGYYNSFALVVALPVRRAGRDDFEMFTRTVITDQVKSGEPVTTDLVVEEIAYLDWLRRFLAGRASADEKQVYQEVGRPDRLDSDAADGSGESAWWYFAAGKVYRFRDRALEQVEPFEPVKPL